MKSRKTESGEERVATQLLEKPRLGELIRHRSRMYYYCISLGSVLDQIESTLVNVDYREKVTLRLHERLKLPRAI
jgi:hypothetical protein